MSFNTVPFNPFPPSSDQRGGGSFELPIAAADTLGGVKVGTGLSINAETGVLTNNNPTAYTLPIAAADTLGGVKVGTGLSINAETGVLSANSQIVDYSTTEQATGQKWIDGQDIYVCTFDQGSDVSIGSSSYTDTNIDASGIAKIIDVMGMQSNGTYKLINASCDSTYVKISSPFSTDTVRYITLFYTKPTTP